MSIQIDCRHCDGDGNVEVSDGHYYGPHGCWTRDHSERCDRCDHGVETPRCWACAKRDADIADVADGERIYVCGECWLAYTFGGAIPLTLPSDLDAVAQLPARSAIDARDADVIRRAREVAL